MNNKKSFVIHKDSLNILDDLTDKQAGILFKTIRDYQNNQPIKLDEITKLVFNPFKNQFIRDDEKYTITCERRAVSGSIGGKKKVANTTKHKQKLAKVANATKHKQEVAKVAESKNDSESDSESDNKKIKKINKKSYPNQCREFIFDEKHKIAIRKKYPDITQTQADNILLEFRHQAENRAKPFKNISSGFLSYLRRGYLDELVLNNRAPKGSVDELEQQEQEYPRILIQKIREKQPDISDKEIERIVEIKKNAYQTQNFVELNNIMKTIGVSYVE